MSSPLDLTADDHDEAVPAARTKSKRRSKRQASRTLATQESDVSQRGLVYYFGDLAFLLLFNIIAAFFGAILRVFSLATGRAVTMTPAEESQLLHEMPIEQRQQMRDIEFLKGNQQQQNMQLDDLRRRVQKIEERRKTREKQA